MTALTVRIPLSYLPPTLPATPLSSSSALVISAASHTLPAPPTPPTSTPATSPKPSYAAIAGRPLLTPPIPLTTPKAKSPWAMPKPVAYMTIEDPFRKVAPRESPPQQPLPYSTYLYRYPRLRGVLFIKHSKNYRHFSQRYIFRSTCQISCSSLCIS